MRPNLFADDNLDNVEKTLITEVMFSEDYSARTNKKVGIEDIYCLL